MSLWDDPDLRKRMGYIPQTTNGQKAASGLGVIALTQEPKLESYRNSPQESMKRFLKAYKVGWFYKAESAISFDVSTMEITLKRGDDTIVELPDKNIPFESLGPVEQCRRLMDQPNPHTSWRKLIEKWQIRVDLAGNAFWFLDEMDEEFGTPTAIYNISPTRMWPAGNSQKITGWVMDWNERGGGRPFTAKEIVHTAAGSADDDVFGVGVVESVLYEWEVNQLLPKHVTDVLTLGGRLAGMVSPKERSLGENEFQDTLRAWRQIANSPDAARRLLVFPEPVEWTRGSATPQEIGLPGLNEINRHNILSAFPISEYRLGVPMDAGLNSGDTRKHMFREHWEFTIHPRAAMLEEIFQHNIVDRFAKRAGEELTFEIKEPHRDDAPSMMEKAAAFRALMNLGFDPEAIIPAVGLEKIKWDPALLEQMIMQAFLGATEAAGQAGGAEGVPGIGSDSHVNRNKDKGVQQRNNAGNPKGQPQKVRLPNPLLAGDVGQRIFVNDSNRKDNVTVSQSVTTQRKAATTSGPGPEVLPALADAAKASMSRFLKAQKNRVVDRITRTWPTTKAGRKGYNEFDWWDEALEDAELVDALGTYLKAGTTAALTNVSNVLDRMISDNAADAALNQSWDLALQDVNVINDTTKAALKAALETGANRGYNLYQIIHGVPDEGFAGIQDALMANHEPIFGEWRAETIARTELMHTYNRGNLLGYAQLGVTHVKAKDGDYDLECRARDGQPFSINEALQERDHPNGTLDWLPLPRDYEFTKAAIDTIRENVVSLKADPPIINVTPAEAPKVIFEPGSIQVNMPPQRSVTRHVDRDEKGQITTVREVADGAES